MADQDTKEQEAGKVAPEQEPQAGQPSGQASVPEAQAPEAGAEKAVEKGPVEEAGAAKPPDGYQRISLEHNPVTGDFRFRHDCPSRTAFYGMLMTAFEMQVVREAQDQVLKSMQKETLRQRLANPGPGLRIPKDGLTTKH